MLTESQVIAGVCKVLENNKFIIVSFCSETQKEYDIVAIHPTDQKEVRIEAKGETSSKRGTRRYGLPFTKSQVLDHVSKALYRAASNISTNIYSGVAFPENEDHIAAVRLIEPALKRLQIEVFWIAPDGNVNHSNYWPTWM
jgi:hypothetical protein